MPLDKRVVQVDAYDEVELWAGGLLQMRVKFQEGKLVALICGPMSLGTETVEIPGIIKALKEEGLSNE